VRSWLLSFALVVSAVSPAGAQQVVGTAFNDYPTEARAEYVFACMAVNGQTPEMLRRCSCSIDVVASIIPYERYIEAETVLALRQVSGERVAPMRSAPVANDLVQELRRAQAEGSVRCF
jgi:hypothetical protein